MGLADVAAKHMDGNKWTWWKRLPADRQAELFSEMQKASDLGVTWAAFRRAIAEQWGESVTRSSFEQAITEFNRRRRNGSDGISKGGAGKAGTGTQGKKKRR